MNTNLKMVANEFGRGREVITDRGMMTLCPCHEDENLKLRLWETPIDDIRAKCLTGCKTKDVMHRIRTILKDKGQQQKKPVTSKIKIYNNNKNLGLSSTELLSMDFENPVIYLDPIIRDQTLMMIYAEPGVGKSWVVHDMALVLTRKNTKDVSIGPWTVTEGCGVLLVDGELPIADLQNRLELLAKPMSEENKSTPLTIWSSMHFEDNDEEGVNLASEKWRNRITNHFVKHPECKLLILDNQASLTDGMNENNKPAWDPINQWFLKMRSMGVAIILVHHANKNGDDRGHSCKRDNLDTVIVLKHDDKLTVDKVGMIVEFEKARSLKPGEAENVYLELKGDNETGLQLVEPAGIEPDDTDQ